MSVKDHRIIPKSCPHCGRPVDILIRQDTITHLRFYSLKRSGEE